MKKFNKILSLLFVAVMAVSCIGGCGKKDDTGLEYDFNVSDKTVEYSFFSPNWNGLPTTNDKVLQSIEEKFNVKLNMIGATNSNWQQNLANLVADQETPDLFFILPNTSTMTDYIKKEVVYDANAFIENSPEDLATLSEVLGAEQFGDNVKINGLNYFIPQTVGTTNRVLMVRKDWMKKWNEEERGKTGDDVYLEPQTLSEFTAMLKFFNSKSLSGSKTYGMALNPDFDFYEDFMATFGVKPDYYLDGDGNYQLSVNSENYENFIKWFREGDGTYLYPEFYSLSEAEAINAFSTGKVGAILSNGSTMIDGLIKGVETTNGASADDLIALITPPNSDDGTHKGAFQSFNFYWGGWAVSATAEEPMRIFKILDYLYSQEGQNLMVHGVKDVHYTVADDGTILPNHDGRKADGAEKVWENKGDGATGSLLGRYRVGSQFMPCPFNVVDGKLVENYPVETSEYPKWQTLSRELTAKNSVPGGLTKIIADPDVNSYNTKIMDAVEQYTISVIGGNATEQEEAKALLDSRLISYKADKVLEYLNQNMK